VASQGRIRLPGGIHIALAAFVCWSALTLRWSILPEYGHERIVTYVQLLCLLWLIWELCTEEKHVLSLLEAYVLGTLVPAAQTAQRFLMGKQTGYNRYSMEGFDPNDLALTLALSLPVSYYLSLRLRRARSWLCLFQLLTTIAAILLTASRGGTLAMAAGLSLVLWTLPTLSQGRRMATISVLALAAIAAVCLVPAASWKRLATVGSEITEGTLNSRTVIWKAGWDAFADAPIGGIGSGAYPEATIGVLGRPWGYLPVAHNSYLSVLVETGLVGFALFTSALAVAGATALRLPGTTGLFWRTLLLVWAIGVFSLTWEYRKPTWVLFGLLAAHSAALHSAPMESRLSYEEHFV